jgi:hypothetical protein
MYGTSQYLLMHGKSLRYFGLEGGGSTIRILRTTIEALR